MGVALSSVGASLSEKVRRERYVENILVLW